MHREVASPLLGGRVDKIALPSAPSATNASAPPVINPAALLSHPVTGSRKGGTADPELHEIESRQVPEWPVGELPSAEPLHLLEPGQLEDAGVLQVREA